MNTGALFVEMNSNVTGQFNVCVLKNTKDDVLSDTSISSRKGIIQNALLFRSYPLVSEEKLRRLPVEGLAVNVSEQVMQPLSVTSFQSAPPLVMPRLESNSPQTRDPEEDLLCIARTFSFLRESGKDPIGTFDSSNKNLLYIVKVPISLLMRNVSISPLGQPGF